MEIRASSRLLAILGDPIAHSLSPLLHNAAMAALGLDAVYVALRVPAPQLPATLTAKGRRVLASCEEAVSELEDAMLDGFSEKDRAAFVEMVKAAVRNLGGGFPSD